MYHKIVRLSSKLTNIYLINCIKCNGLDYVNLALCAVSTALFCSANITSTDKPCIRLTSTFKSTQKTLKTETCQYNKHSAITLPKAQTLPENIIKPWEIARSQSFYQLKTYSA